MPEMPEVETIRRTLADKVVGKTIKKVEILLSRLIKWPSAPEFQAIITGKKIVGLSRRGKYLLFFLEDQLVLVVHLRMTGRLYYAAAGEPSRKATHIKFIFDGGDALWYADTRTLGTLYAMKEEELWRISGLANMGPEPLSSEFTVEYLKKIFAKRQGKIKALLLNQKYIGGLGNIYVDESLALAGIHPERKAGNLSTDEIEKLHSAINEIIRQAILDGGTTFRDYVDGEGKQGTHQNHLRVYGRKNQPCLVCGTAIEWKEVGGRGTHFCPHCQH
jgi:formamidopyrimidine-DNA glycosylase